MGEVVHRRRSPAGRLPVMRGDHKMATPSLPVAGHEMVTELYGEATCPGAKPE